MTSLSFDWLIVGAGFTGSTLAERLANDAGARVLLIDRRPHPGGNAWDAYDENGVLVHPYGPHIFHTNSQKVWDYLSQFTIWRPYEHHVEARIGDRNIPLPFNFNSIERLFPKTEAERLQARLLDCYGPDKRVPILEMRRHDDVDIQALAEFVYKNVFESYTRKQWGLDPDALSASVTARVPILLGRDDRYFQDTWQAMPIEGFHVLFGRMLESPNITLQLETPFEAIKDKVHWKRMVWTGPLDEYFGCRYGRLPYRTIRFEKKIVARSEGLPVTVLNFPNDHAFTRITDMSLLTAQEGPRTALIYEYPGDYEPGLNEPYYPIPRDENRALCRKYEDAADLSARDVLFAGRLGTYQYLNMDQAVASALALYTKITDLTSTS
jgi:UDP-galactopyranose mutase